MSSLRLRHFLAMGGVTCFVAAVVSIMLMKWNLALLCGSLGGLGIGFAALLTPDPVD